MQTCPMKSRQLDELLAAAKVHWGLPTEVVAANDENEIDIPNPIVILTDKKGRDTHL